MAAPVREGSEAVAALNLGTLTRASIRALE
jgi:hypothetical protein